MLRLTITLVTLLFGSFAQDAKAGQRPALIVAHQAYPMGTGPPAGALADGAVLRRALLNAKFHLPLATGGRAVPSPARPILVWNVANPHTDRVDPTALVPRELERRARALGYVVEVKVIPAKEFAPRLFEALGNDERPDMISIDNVGHLMGITTALGKFTGVETNPEVKRNLVALEEATDEFGSRGQRFLLRGSPSYDAARAMAEELVNCDEAQSEGPPGDLSELRRVSEIAAAKHVECRPIDSEIADPERLPTECSRDWPPLQAKATKTCRISGNDRLVFVSSAVAIDGPQRTGWRSVVTVLRKTDRWRALTVASDRASTRQFGSAVVPFSKKLVFAADASQEALGPPAPKGPLPSPEAEARDGEFVWTGAPSPEFVGEIAEFNYGHDTLLLLYPKLLLARPDGSPILDRDACPCVGASGR